MKEQDIRTMIDGVKDGRLSRRDFVSRMIAVGISAPYASLMLAHNGVAMAQTPSSYPARSTSGGGGPLKLLYWQAVTLINPHFAVGSKDQEGSRVFYEPLGAWDAEGNLIPVLAASIPTFENGLLARDGKSVTWKLKPNVKWHDGKPFTADDVIFNWQYSKDPATAAVTIGSYKDIVVEKIDDLTVKVLFERPTPFWADPFCGAGGMIIPKHIFADYIGGKSREAPANLRPVGTGPYRFVSFVPGDTLRGERNPDYHMPGRPFFDTIELKGGGDAVSAARAVIQSGEFDFAWNMQVEDEVLKRMEQGGRGQAVISFGGDIEHVQLNPTDPNAEVDGERSSIKTTHPSLTDPAVREALNLLLDRSSIERFIYGRTGQATANFLNNPEKFRSKATSFEFSLEKANAILDRAGWVRGADGIRAKGGVRLRYLYQTSTNAPRQRTQAIYKQAAQRAGIDLELKSVVASVFFSSDVANPDTYTKFYSDIQMYTTTMTQPDAERFMNQFCSWEIATKDNKWQGRNIVRFRSEEYDKLFREGEAEIDPVKRAAIFVKLNEIIIASRYIIPVVYRPSVSAVSNRLKTPKLSGWDVRTSELYDWHTVTS
ncbi:MAG: peptide ABC transporter substrate-binding protein [Alphaproteobacteria bacterium]